MVDSELSPKAVGSKADSPKVIVITGASDGIGAAAARALARPGHRLILVGRSPEKTRRVAAETGAAAMTADFASLAQVGALAQRLLAALPRIDVLVNNAGGIGGSRPSRTEDGHEWTIQVNHLAPFLLTRLLGDRLTAGGGRVVVTASRASTGRHADLDPDRLDDASGYRPMRAYANAKLANVAFAAELPERLPGVRAVSFHPGLIRSNFAAGSAPVIRTFMRSPARRFMRSPEQGADTLVWLATAGEGELVDGAYYIDRKPAPRNPVVDDPEFRRRLWDRTAEAVDPAP
jgi:NAD(P)-dependent dehydrogenase (short-subunit alcohol dehydrogenase family)